MQLEGIRSRDSAFRCNCGDPCLFGNGKDTGISVPLGADKAADKMRASRKTDLVINGTASAVCSSHSSNLSHDFIAQYDFIDTEMNHLQQVPVSSKSKVAGGLLDMSGPASYDSGSFTISFSMVPVQWWSLAPAGCR